jgi:hypothetical protein
MPIPVLQLGPGGDYTTQYHAHQGTLIAVTQTGEPAGEDRSAGQFAKQTKQFGQRPPRTVSVHPEPITRPSDSYQPSKQSISTGTYGKPAPRPAMAQQTTLDRLLHLAPQLQQQALDMLADALDQLSPALSSDATTASQASPGDSERQRAIAHVLEDLHQLRRDLNLADRPTPSSSSPLEVAYESSTLTESDPQATGHRPANSSVPPSKGLFTDDAGAGRRPERQQGYSLRTRRSAHQKRRPYQGAQQGSLFGG